MEAPARVIFTVGHSTRSAEEFAALLRAHGVEAIADVRLIPKSRRYPHFNHDQLARWLPEVGIDSTLAGWDSTRDSPPSRGSTAA